ncbi:MAG: NAD-dependent epimerase/dehydratase family protein [Phycisphaerales bacterium]|nr:MAG: NAD-dependent epimerase/dehydratase family protein [Phycisphaerales bacterium]
MNVLITGSSGLIGSEAAIHYAGRGATVHGIDNNQRKRFFGPEGDTTANLRRVQSIAPDFVHYDLDIRFREGVLDLFSSSRFDLIIHCAAQPSPDLAASLPFDDFDTNAVGTLNLLEATRRHCPEAVFIHMSTNKVYGDGPNRLPLVELETRYDYEDPLDRNGIAEDFGIDQSLHSLFGASKAAADLLAQEYGRYFDLKVGVFRGGCLTGPQHAGVELHGFLSYLIKVARSGWPYTVFGYKGKQVRDQIHCADVISAFDAFYQNPRCGEVYNLGGGRENSASVLECIDLIEQRTGRKIDWTYHDEPRRGDHICYITNLSKFRSHYPNWSITRTIPDMIGEMFQLAAAA